ncbi:MAG TPA: alpha/beta fold hydrolase [Pirellulales bacterium]|nr:alpha/beta fold hydrolase [Pirellulales bacterium]
MYPTRLPAPVRDIRSPATLAILATVAWALPLGAALETQDDKPLPPQEATLKTADNITLAATFYPSKLGKEAVPVVLLHASKGSRGDFEELALELQRAGHAVMVPDFRGHGDSTQSRFADRAAELRTADYLAMADEDMEAVKNYLMIRNNAGELNIDKLCLVGVEMGAAVAVNWAARDWSWPMLTTGKQGQDVKALVLVSPEWSFKGMRISEAMAHPNVRSDLSVMIIAGKGNSKAMQEARRLHNALEKYHPPPPADLAAEKQTLWLKTPQTSLQAMRLLNEKSMHVDQMIAKFIELRLVKKQIPWSDRKHPLD